MGKTLVYKLFGVGKITNELKAQLEREGVVLQEEGISGSTTYKNFRRPGAYASWRRVGYSASLTITQTRVVGLANSSLIINVPFTDTRLRRLNISVEKDDTLLVAFDASLFHTNWSGNIEYRFHTPQAQVFLYTLLARST